MSGEATIPVSGGCLRGANKTKMMTGAEVFAAFGAADAGGQHS